MKIACKGLCVAMVLCCCTVIRAQNQEAWTFGGNGGVSWSDWMELNVMVDDFSTPSAIQPRELRPGVNLLPQLTALGDAVSLSSPEGSFWSRWQKPLDPFWEDGLPRMWRGYQNLSWATVFMPIETYVDGDPTTFNWFLNFGPGCNKTASEFYTIDVGASVPVTGFRLVEPPETETDPSGNPWAEGYSPTDRFGEPWANYIPKHGEFSGALDPAPIAIEGEDEHICSLVYKPLEFVLGGVEQNLVAPIEFTFPRQYLRFFRWRTFPENTRTVGGQTASSVLSIAKIAYAEFELYGDGFAAESRFRSHVVDLGRTATLGAVTVGVSKWRREGDVLVEAPDADAGLSIRVKTGSTPDPRQYHTYNDQSEYVEISGEEFSQLKVRANPQDPQWVGWQGPVTEDRTNWTPWSGMIKDSGIQVGLRSGQYFTVEVKMESGTPADMVRLDSLSIEVSPLLASRLVGELALADDALFPAMPEIPVGEEVVISYAISAGVEPGSDGFDALHIATPSQPRFLSLMAGNPLAALEPEVSARGGGWPDSVPARAHRKRPGSAHRFRSDSVHRLGTVERGRFQPRQERPQAVHRGRRCQPGDRQRSAPAGGGRQLGAPHPGRRRHPSAGDHPEPGRPQRPAADRLHPLRSPRNGGRDPVLRPCGTSGEPVFRLG